MIQFTAPSLCSCECGVDAKLVRTHTHYWLECPRCRITTPRFRTSSQAYNAWTEGNIGPIQFKVLVA